MGFEVIFFIAILIVSVVVHEVSHGFAADLLGDPTARIAGRLTLNPIPHIDPVGSILVPAVLSLIPGGIVFGWAKPVPFNPYNLRAGKWGPALVAVAGPVSNLLIAFIFAGVIRWVLPLGLISAAAGQIVVMVVVLNIVLALFNLIPIPPLDGSKILFALIPYRWRGVGEIMERYQLVLILLVILAAWSWLWPVVNLVFTLLTGRRL